MPFSGGYALTSAGLKTIARAAECAASWRDIVRARVSELCGTDAEKLNRHQHQAHGFAWVAAYAGALEALPDWARALDDAGRFGRAAQLIARIGAGEYLAQFCGGIAMSQDEIVRPSDFGLQEKAAVHFADPVLRELMGDALAGRAELVALLQQTGPDTLTDLSDAEEMLGIVRGQFRAFATKEIAPFAQDWHRGNKLIPLDLISKLAGLGVFGLTAAEEFGGSAMGILAMCAVTEELSRGYIGAGSLGTRSEIAVELIRSGGTEEQRQRWLRPIISGEVLPTAVFTEPNAGSDLASLTTRAERDGDHYVLHGAKTWITHAARADLMLVLARTGEPGSGHRGLSMFLVKKPRGSDIDPFPLPGLSGSEIHVLGYRGMREYELAFDGLRVPASALLGDREGEGFRQLMATFELARIQTAARALGVAQNAFELAFAYARERKQFGRPIVDFPRVHNKLAWMAVETMMVRQLVNAVARKKEAGGRCDVEAGMAKLLAARVAWSCADNALQIHGGTGYALEYPVSRLLCDARILNIFEGAAEIQAHVIARGLLAR
jgi:(2S)-methylsuccinyl-CoA dehydrogenase